MRAFLLASCLISVIGCTLDHGDGNAGRRPETPITGGQSCAAVEPLFRNCGLLTAGAFTDCDEPEDAEERCQFDCLSRSSCDELRGLVCNDGDGPPPGALTQCFLACQPPPFNCGDGTLVSSDFVCDGGFDCPSGADENDCGFQCAGTDFEVQQFQVCDGFAQCPAGDDEEGCSSDGGTFICPGGFAILETFVCDGFNDCGDNSDEQGCESGAEFVCE